MNAQTRLCFDCDEPLSAEALQWHDSRCPACADMDYDRATEQEAPELRMEQPNA
jgi:hypothetical protein